MFKVKKKRIEGQCDAMRCKSAVCHECTAGYLCGRHYKEWLEAGEPTVLDLAVGVPPEKISLSNPGGPDPELLEAFKDFEIESQEDYFTIASVLHDAIDGREKDDNARKEAGRPHYEPWKAVNETWKGTLAAWDDLISAVKARIIAAKEALESAQDEAMAQGKPLPPGLEDPPGVSVKPEIQVHVANMNLVPEWALKRVIDTDAVLEYVLDNPREEIPGLGIKRGYTVSFRRPSADK